MNLDKDSWKWIQVGKFHGFLVGSLVIAFTHTLTHVLIQWLLNKYLPVPSKVLGARITAIPSAVSQLRGGYLTRSQSTKQTLSRNENCNYCLNASWVPLFSEQMSTCPSPGLTQMWMSDPWVMWKVWHCKGKYILQCLQCFWTFTFHSQSSNGQENFMKTKSLRKYLLKFIDQASFSLSPPLPHFSFFLFSLLVLSSDVDHIKIIHVTNWSSHCPWLLIPNSPASQSSDVLLGVGFVFSGSKVDILGSVIYLCQHFSWDNCYRYLHECDLYESMTSHHTLNVSTQTYPSST